MDNLTVATKVFLIFWAFLFIVPNRSTPLPTCVIEAYSQPYSGNDNLLVALRTNKCVLRTSYSIRSSVIQVPGEPRYVVSGQTCCCTVTEDKLMSPTIGNVRVKFKEIVACGCVDERACPSRVVLSDNYDLLNKKR